MPTDLIRPHTATDPNPACNWAIVAATVGSSSCFLVCSFMFSGHIEYVYLLVKKGFECGHHDVKMAA